ncbi:MULTISPECIES: alpha/beta hydrolase [Actinosynnema]|uniref:alpha/beta hydrolase n=1 Tax=Actinosynnema TaxID=40566 RepID=UPI0020A2C35D|nr:alpha/beta hydrolase [Actinosynnema pretiosum]MCP2095619.1 Pimeloyl-ACP methyl ester carboxylesterase [Actinosynnema pretiosum]
MRPLVRVLGVVVASVLLAGTAQASPSPTGISWAPCPELADVECGELSVPVDRADPGDGRVGVAVARRVASDPARRIGVLVVNPGGPGNSGVDFVLRADGVFSPEVLARFDVVGFDPRGVGRSGAVVCSAEVVGRRPRVAPGGAAEFAALAAYNAELEADCRARTGPLHDHVDTLSVVEDVEALRVALGERRISFYGLSYGTLLGQQYAERHGARVRGVVVDSNVDHSQGTWRYAEVEAAGAEDAFEEFVAWCGRTSGCALHGRDVGAVWRGLLERAERGTLVLPGAGTPITADALRKNVRGAFYAPAWASLAELLVALEAEPETVVAERESAAGADVVAEPFPAVFCQDWALPVRDFREYAALTARVRRVAPNMGGGQRPDQPIGTCLGRSADVANPQRPLRITGAPKVLMLNGAHDPATPLAGALNAHRQAGGAVVLVTYEGGGHGVYQRSACTRGVVDAYLLDGVVPEDGTRCPAVEPGA